MNNTMKFTAVFPKVQYAESFATKIVEPGWWTSGVTRKGRTVTFTITIPEGKVSSRDEVFGDYLMTVGYHGSTSRGRATLNGIAAPVQY